MNTINYIKAAVTAVLAFVASILGVLAVPVGLMVICNIIDYATGLLATPFREEKVNSYKSIRGITKKVAMWILVIIGAVLDELIIYAVSMLGYTAPFTFLVACVVAIWIVCSEIISILENISDMGVPMPRFLLPLVKHIKVHVEEKVTVDILDNDEGA